MRIAIDLGGTKIEAIALDAAGRELNRRRTATPAGEWGHNPRPAPRDPERPGPPCHGGRSGCTETFLSGPGFARDHAAGGGATTAPTEVVERAGAGDRLGEAALARYEVRPARALATVINVLDPHVIVLGGGMSNVARIYANVPRLWRAHVFSDRVGTRLLPPRHGHASGVRGAAWRWPEPAPPR